MNKTTKTILAAFAVAMLGCGLLCEQAYAITGSIQFFGSASASGASGAGQTTISFTNPWDVLQGTGDYASVPAGTDTTFTNFSFTGDGASAALTGSVTPLWSFTFNGLNYSFDLLQLTNGHTESGSMSFAGTGIAHITGFGDTAASFSMQGAGNNGPFTFQLSSSSTTAQGVPEGGTTAALFGLALVGLLTLRQRLAA